MSDGDTAARRPRAGLEFVDDIIDERRGGLREIIVQVEVEVEIVLKGKGYAKGNVLPCKLERFFNVGRRADDRYAGPRGRFCE